MILWQWFFLSIQSLTYSITINCDQGHHLQCFAMFSTSNCFHISSALYFFVASFNMLPLLPLSLLSGRVATWDRYRLGQSLRLSRGAARRSQALSADTRLLKKGPAGVKQMQTFQAHWKVSESKWQRRDLKSWLYETGRNWFTPLRRDNKLLARDERGKF